MSDMADVLHQHQDSQAANGGRYCICGNWEGPWTGNGFAAHQAAALTTAGFGPVQAARAEAWDEAVNEADRQWQIGHASAAILKADNPYRTEDT
jgi:hypothetical protein